MFTVRRLLVLAAVCVLGLSVAACGNSGNGSATATTEPVGYLGAQQRPQPGLGPHRRHDEQCAPVHGGWSAGGTIKNTLGHDATYQITVFFTSAQASDLAYAETSATVNAHQNGTWTATATFDCAEHGALRPPGRRRQLTAARAVDAGAVTSSTTSFVFPFAVVLVVVGTACVDPPSVQGYGFHGSDCVFV